MPSAFHPDEHEVFGRATEAQNCLAEAAISLAELNGADAVRISEALARGRFVVVITSTHYCRATDAIAGERRSFGGSFVERAEAEAVAATVNAGGDGEVQAHVLPEPPVVPPPVSAAQDDEAIPF